MYDDYNKSYNSDNFDDVNNGQSGESDNAPQSDTDKKQESSYEWNADKSGDSVSSGEYHYSYVNGNNENASHNPNNYENAYSSSRGGNQYSSQSYNSNAQSDYSQNTQSAQNTQNPYGGYNSQVQYGNYSGQQYSAQGYNNPNNHPHVKAKKVKKQKVKKPKVKKPKKPVTRGSLAAVLVISIIASAAFGFAGGYYANKSRSTSDGSININQVTASNTSDNDTESTAGTASKVVKKTADSVVEIATESVVTGSFAQQYIQQGAGSGVIISDDGYIITNYHVIEGANNVTVTLRDGQTGYTAAVIGYDEDNDIALLKVDATGLSPATFGNSSDLAVGDYVVAIGNPLGELGGTVTDGIISALAREVTIEDKNMTLLQTNAQISPGNSGGGLFNSSGELVGIVNAKDSATEVEGIAFAIPINNVLDIISDLKSYGYVTGKIDLGMQFTDINSNESAFYYGVNNKGCYVVSVTKGSNAEKAGFRTGDMVVSVNGTEITSATEIDGALENAKVGDTAKFKVYRSGRTISLDLTLAEYVPSGGSLSSNQSSTSPTNSNDSIWSQMFGW